MASSCRAEAPAWPSGATRLVASCQPGSTLLPGDVIGFSPPLVITEAEIDTLLERFAVALSQTQDWVKTWR